MDEIKRTFNVGDVIYWRWKGEKTYVRDKITDVVGELISFSSNYCKNGVFIDTNEIDVA
jgi:RPA family protein